MGSNIGPRRGQFSGPKRTPPRSTFEDSRVRLADLMRPPCNLGALHRYCPRQTPQRGPKSSPRGPRMGPKPINTVLNSFRRLLPLDPHTSMGICSETANKRIQPYAQLQNGGRRCSPRRGEFNQIT